MDSVSAVRSDLGEAIRRWDRPVVVGRRRFLMGSSHYYEPVAGSLSDQARVLDMTVLRRREYLTPRGTFSRSTLHKMCRQAVRAGEAWVVGPVPSPAAVDDLADELTRAEFWVPWRRGSFRLADGLELLAFWEKWEAARLQQAQERRRADRKVRRFLRAQDIRCAHCGGRERLRLDHIVPVAAGGTSDDANLRVLCHWCNGARNLPELRGSASVHGPEGGDAAFIPHLTAMLRDWWELRAPSASVRELLGSGYRSDWLKIMKPWLTEVATCLRDWNEVHPEHLIRGAADLSVGYSSWSDCRQPFEVAELILEVLRVKLTEGSGPWWERMA